MPLKVIVVGAGIAGLAAAVGLARSGHEVLVYERREETEREASGSGIQFQPQVVKILEGWGIFEKMKAVTHDNVMTCIRNHQGCLAAHVDFRERGPLYYGLRSMIKDVFRDFAIELGVQVKEGVKISDIDQVKAAVILENGSRAEADLIVGADGSGSRVRRSLFPQHKPSMSNNTTFQILLPMDVVEKDSSLKTLPDGMHAVIYIAPNRFIFSSPLLHQNKFDMQLIDTNFTRDHDPNPNVYNERLQDLSVLKHRWENWGPAVRKAIDVADGAFKWRIAEVSGVPSWSSENGRIVLLGDSAHAMVPYAGQGSAMGIEDAAVLSELFAKSSTRDDIERLTDLYEKIRRPRCEKVHQYARFLGYNWSTDDLERIKVRDRNWSYINKTNYQHAKADPKAAFGSGAFQQWLDSYDVVDVVREALSNPPLTSARL